jgi:hypothetical protein
MDEESQNKGQGNQAQREIDDLTRNAAAFDRHLASSSVELG